MRFRPASTRGQRTRTGPPPIAGYEPPVSAFDPPVRSHVEGPAQSPSADRRAVAFARLFEAAHLGVYIGTVASTSTSTIAANPHLKLIFGHVSNAPESGIRPFDRGSFLDPDARRAFLDRLTADGAIADYLLRLRRADDSPVWVEVTARAERAAS